MRGGAFEFEPGGGSRSWSFWGSFVPRTSILSGTKLYERNFLAPRWGWGRIDPCVWLGADGQVPLNLHTLLLPPLPTSINSELGFYRTP